LTALQYIVQLQQPPEVEGEECNTAPADNLHDNNERLLPRESVAQRDTVTQETLVHGDNIYEEIDFS
jgi:hypothetical protein